MFSIDDVTHIANLSSLELNEEEKKRFAQQFSTILDYFKILETIDVPTEIVDPNESLLVISREDEPRAGGVSPQQFSPYIEHQGFKVPKVIDSSS